MIASQSGILISGGTFNAINQTTISHTTGKRGIDILMEWVATDAFHNSDELPYAPKCHPQTRLAVLDDIMKWVNKSGVQNDFIMWLFGSAGGGKSAIAKNIAELAAEKGLLIGTFFFSRTSPKRNSKDRLIPTLAYQLAQSIPDTRAYIEEAIERDLAIFNKNLQTQIDTLLIKPFQSVSTQITPLPKLVIIDGLDECNDTQAQLTILNAISCSFSNHKLPMIFLVASRPEIDLVSWFDSHDPLKSIHCRLPLDATYRPDDDIRLYFSDKFEQIRCTHRLRSKIPIPWPTEELLGTLVERSSGQFIFAATVVRFVESIRHRPAARLNIILGISPAGTTNPFKELDGLYTQILSSVHDIKLTLRVLSLYTAAPSLAQSICKPAERFLSLEEGDIDLALVDLSSIVSYNESSGHVNILHASFVDFLSDKRRSNEFYIDMASARTEFACRTLEYVKGPDGIQAGDIYLFVSGFGGGNWILNGQLRREILKFDLDAFITATIKYYDPIRRFPGISTIFALWMRIILTTAGLEDGDRQALIYRCKNSFESRVQKYQSDWRLQLLLTLAVVMDYNGRPAPESRTLDILLGMDDPDLHLVDQNALGLRYCGGFSKAFSIALTDITLLYVDGDSYASAALHCMRFLSKPPKYSKTNGPEMGVTYAEWKATCEMALDMLCRLLERAYTSPEVMEFMSNHDIDTTVQKNFPVIDVWQVDAHILAFLSRGGVCVNWRIVSAIRRALDPTGYWYVNETGNLLITKMKVKNIKLKDTKKDEGAHEDKDQDEDKSETR